jgi:hypothetical protein
VNHNFYKIDNSLATRPPRCTVGGLRLPGSVPAGLTAVQSDSGLDQQELACSKGGAMVCAAFAAAALASRVAARDLSSSTQERYRPLCVRHGWIIIVA